MTFYSEGCIIFHVRSIFPAYHKILADIIIMGAHAN